MKHSNNQPPMQAKVYVPGTIGNVGPGFDVLGLAVSGLGDTVTLTLSPDKLSDEVAFIRGTDAHLVPTNTADNAIIISARHLLAASGHNYGITIGVERQLPIAGGLGSSAAASVAGALGAAAALGIEFTRRELLEAALAGESHSAGLHLDNIAPCLLGGLTGVLSPVPPVIMELPVNCNWWLALITPDQRLPTREAREVLPDSLPQKEWVEMSARTLAVSHAFATGDRELMRMACQDPYAEPRRAPLVPDFSRVRKKALDAGALACSLSGAGPTIFAICKDQPEAEKIADAMEASLTSPPRMKHHGPVDRKGARIL